MQTHFFARFTNPIPAACAVFPMPVAEPLNVRSVLILQSDRLYADLLRQYTLRVFPCASVRLAATIDAAELALAGKLVDLMITGVSATAEGDVLDLIARCAARTLPAPRKLVVIAQCEYRVLLALQTLSADAVFDAVAETPEHFVKALRCVAAGGRYWSPTLLDHVQRRGAPANVLFRVLTNFEQLVLALIGDGSDDVVAARELGLSPATVGTVRRELHRKLGVQHRGELVRFAAQHGFVRFTAGGIVRPGYALLSAAYHARRVKRSVEGQFARAGAEEVSLDSQGREALRAVA
jgi:DNA-binding NarL/FixJ family response regulator